MAGLDQLFAAGDDHPVELTEHIGKAFFRTGEAYRAVIAEHIQTLAQGVQLRQQLGRGQRGHLLVKMLHHIQRLGPKLRHADIRAFLAGAGRLGNGTLVDARPGGAGEENLLGQHTCRAGRQQAGNKLIRLKPQQHLAYVKYHIASVLKQCVQGEKPPSFVTVFSISHFCNNFNTFSGIRQKM